MPTRKKASKLEEPPDVEMVSDEDIGHPKTKKMSRSEKSKCAAKNRRDKEAVEFANLIETLPVACELVNRLDKSSIVRLIIAYMRIKHFVQREMAHISNEIKGNKRHVSLSLDTPTVSIGTEGTPVVSDTNNSVTSKGTEVCSKTCINDKNLFGGLEESMMMLSALNGFLMLLDKKKTIMFVSDNVEDYIGLSQAKLIGNHIKDFIHPDDIPEIRKQYNLQTHTNGTPTPLSADPLMHLDNQRLFYVRMKYCLARPGTKTQQSGYTLVQWSGKIKMRKSVSKALGYGVDCLLCICRPMQTNSVLEIRMDGNMFMSRHDLGMRFTFCDSRIITLIGYEPSEVIGKTAYQFHNPLDAGTVGKCHSNLIVKGTSVSKYYRFIGKSCDWVWMQTRATIIYNTSNEPQYVVCMNYIISEEEGQRYLLMEQEAQTASCAKGIMDLSCSGPSASSDKQTCKVEKLVGIPSTSSMGDHSEQSDSGYYSANSPYSSINPSPTGTQFEEDPGIVVTTDTKSQFPVTVFSEVANTINPADPADENTILELIGSMNKENNDSSLDMADRFGNFSGGGEWIDQQQELSQKVYQQNPSSNLSSLLSDVTSPKQMSPQQLLSPETPLQAFNGDSAFESSVNASLLSGQTGSPESNMSHGTPQSMMSVNDDSNMSNSSLQSSGAGQRVTQTPSFQRMQQAPSGSSFCDLFLPNSSSTVSSSLAGSTMQTMPLLPRNHSFPTLSQTYTCTSTVNTVTLPQNGMVNVQIATLNTGTESAVTGSNGDALPSELSDFCMEFCESMSDRQAQQILEELGGQKELLTAFEELRSQNQGSEKMTVNKKEDHMGYLARNQMNSDVPSPYNTIVAHTMDIGVSPNTSGCGSCGSTSSLGLQQFSSQMPPPTTFTVSKAPSNFPISVNNDMQSNISCTVSQSLQYNTNRDAMSCFPQRPIMNTYVNNMEQQTFASQQQPSMSELEKMLRGYSQRTNGQNVDICIPQTNCPPREVISPGGSTLLQQMLTGHLSGDCYHAMEKRRQATVGLRPKPQ